jgi:carboxyl-terminal processing protease
LIVFTKIKKENTKKHTRLKGGFETGKVFVLQNENSASAVKFWLVRFKITIGDYRGTSFLREGLVQREMDFDDGSAVRLTVADIIRYRSLDTKPYLKGMKNILMSQKSVLRVVNYMKRDSIK